MKRELLEKLVALFLFRKVGLEPVGQSSDKTVADNCKAHNPLSTLLCGEIDTEKDKVNDRKVVSLKERQITIFDYSICVFQEESNGLV